MLADDHRFGSCKGFDGHGLGGGLGIARSPCNLPSLGDRRNSVGYTAWHNLYHGPRRRLLKSGVGKGFFALKVLAEELPRVVIVSSIALDDDQFGTCTGCGHV